MFTFFSKNKEKNAPSVPWLSIYIPLETGTVQTNDTIIGIRSKDTNQINFEK